MDRYAIKLVLKSSFIFESIIFMQHIWQIQAENIFLYCQLKGIALLQVKSRTIKWFSKFPIIKFKIFIVKIMLLIYN